MEKNSSLSLSMNQSVAQIKEQMQSSFNEGRSLKDEGRNVEALKKFDELQQFIKQTQGENSPDLQAVYSEIAILCNVLAMAHLKREDFKLCQDLIKKAEKFVENNDRLKAITYNNYACLFRKTNKLRNALNYLEQALDLEYRILNRSEDAVNTNLMISNPCEIHLNICATLSQMDKHELALHHAMKALVLIQDEVLLRAEGESEGEKGSLQDRYTVMIIALHNIAVEHEYLKHYQYALENYSKAFEFAKTTLGPEHDMAKKMEMVHEQAKQKVNDIFDRQMKKKKTGNSAKEGVSHDLSDLLSNGLLLSQDLDGQFKGMTSPKGNPQASFRAQKSPTRVPHNLQPSMNPYIQGGKQKSA